MENDLKKEIKRLQKFREQIKIWQLNDVIKTLSLSSTTLSNKLNDNKKLIEEAMEVYKDVERSSKLKTFSNQSIMMAANMDKGDDDDDDDDSEDYDDFDFDDSDDEEHDDDESLELSTESRESLNLLKSLLSDITQQSKKLDHEFGKLSQKKLRKNNLAIIESKKEKIKATKDQNKFHTKKLMKLIRLLKANNLIDINLIRILHEDIKNYLESNNEVNFENDTTLYDDIFNLITGDEHDYSMHEDSEILSTPKKTVTEVSNILPNGNGKASTSTSTHISSYSHPINISIPSSPIPRRTASPEMASPAIIKVLKPASTPSKPLGGLKWSMAAAAGIPEVKESPIVRSKTPEVPILESIPVETTEVPIRAEIPISKPTVQTNDLNYKYVEVLKNSQLSNTELNLFSDLNLVKLPPGIQDLIISFTSKRNNSHDFSLLYDSKEYNQFVTPINKPYLPSVIQSSYNHFNTNQFKPPLQLFKLQSYWNRIRANNQIEQFVGEIKSLTAQNNAENSPAINELTLVLFYGFYYGLTPVENLIAESCLFQLGWKPYRNKVEGTVPSQPIGTPSSTSQAIRNAETSTKAGNYFYWFRRIKLLSTSQEEPATFEFGDYQVFDLSFWEIFAQHGFKFEYNLCQIEPSNSLV